MEIITVNNNLPAFQIFRQIRGMQQKSRDIKVRAAQLQM